MFCRKCGKQLDDGFKVCPYCGEPVSLAESDAMRAAQEQPAEKAQSLYNNIPLPSPAPEQADVSDSASDSKRKHRRLEGSRLLPRLLRPRAVVFAARQPRALFYMEGRQAQGLPRAWVSSR